MMRSRIPRTLAMAILTILAVAGALAAHAVEKKADRTVESNHPGLASGILKHAVLRNLPEGRVLESQSLTITEDDMQEAIKELPKKLRDAGSRHQFALLEQKAAEMLLARDAGLDLTKSDWKSDKKSEQVITDHVMKAIGDLTPTDAEVEKFYKENQDMFGGAALKDIREQLQYYVAQQKQQDAAQEYIESLAKRVPVHVSADWVKQQAALAQDNPVDKARASNTPTLVDFGADGCRPCDMMQPILANLKKRFEGKLNVEFVHVREHPMLASRFGVRSIPTLVIFNEAGKEIWRHTGFVPEKELEKHLAKVGVK